MYQIHPSPHRRRNGRNAFCGYISGIFADMGEVLFNHCAVSGIEDYFCFSDLHSKGPFCDIDGFFRVVPDGRRHILGVGSHFKVDEKSLVSVGMLMGVIGGVCGNYVGITVEYLIRMITGA